VRHFAVCLLWFGDFVVDDASAAAAADDDDDDDDNDEKNMIVEEEVFEGHKRKRVGRKETGKQKGDGLSSEDEDEEDDSLEDNQDEAEDDNLAAFVFPNKKNKNKLIANKKASKTNKKK
jgi:hypothetical protein